MNEEARVHPEERQGELLLILLKIQDKDIKIRRLIAELQAKPEEVAAMKERLGHMAKDLESSREKLKKQMAQRNSLEVDLEARIGNINKLEAQSSLVKTNEEYRAMMKEIESLKKGNTPLEDKILDVMEVIEEEKKLLEGQEDALKTEEQKVAQRERTIQEEVSGIRARLEEIKKEKEAHLGSVKPEFLERYNMIFENKNDFAIVTIEHGACGGCHMAITPQIMNEVKRGHDLILCENCARILCLPVS